VSDCDEIVSATDSPSRLVGNSLVASFHPRPRKPRRLASVRPLRPVSRVGGGRASVRSRRAAGARPGRRCWRSAPLGRRRSVGGCVAVPCRRVAGAPLSRHTRWSSGTRTCRSPGCPLRATPRRLRSSLFRWNRSRPDWSCDPFRRLERLCGRDGVVGNGSHRFCLQKVG
jgi:hypothetical protein